jgi:hypothetical protein
VFGVTPTRPANARWVSPSSFRTFRTSVPVTEPTIRDG